LIIVTGAIVGAPETIDELVALSLEHVRRSRTEPGCVSHNVHRDVEHEHRLVFVERWADRDALSRHFAVPASIEFVRAAMKLAAETPAIEIYEASETSV
jgi:quinol monooxygenase YgiN